ncbi:unnamed protein product, partial [Ectocarpus fasciculatus]
MVGKQSDWLIVFFFIPLESDREREREKREMPKSSRLSSRQSFESKMFVLEVRGRRHGTPKVFEKSAVKPVSLSRMRPTHTQTHDARARLIATGAWKREVGVRGGGAGQGRGLIITKRCLHRRCKYCSTTRGWMHVLSIMQRAFLLFLRASSGVMWLFGATYGHHAAREER